MNWLITLLYNLDLCDTNFRLQEFSCNSAWILHFYTLYLTVSKLIITKAWGIYRASLIVLKFLIMINYVLMTLLLGGYTKCVSTKFYSISNVPIPQACFVYLVFLLFFLSIYLMFRFIHKYYSPGSFNDSYLNITRDCKNFIIINKILILKFL